MDIRKAFFRYLRGELLNGFYIRKLNLSANTLVSMESLKTELLHWLNFQFIVDTEDYPIKHQDLKGIGQVAGITSLLGLSSYLNGWVRLSESHIVSGEERSERGLLNQESGEIEYFRTLQDNYPTDIETIATDASRMVLRPVGIEPIGYVWGDNSESLLENGFINPEMLHATPPEGYLFNSVTNDWYWPFNHQTTPPPIYAPWYGNKFLPLAAGYPSTVVLSDSILYLLILIHQKIKYNGVGLGYLFDLTSAIIPDLITALKLELLDGYASTGFHVWYYKMTFTRIENNFYVNDGWGRFSAWLYIIQSKYPFIQFNETGN